MNLYMANTVRLPWHQLHVELQTDNVPLPYVVLKGWTRVFGEGEAALRSLSASRVRHGCGRHGPGGTSCGRGTGRHAGCAASGDQPEDRPSARSDGAALRDLVPVCRARHGTVACALVRRSSEGVPPRLRHAILLSLTHVLGLLTHPTYVFALAACTIASLSTTTRPGRQATVASAGIGVCVYLALWWPVLSATLASQATSWMPPPKAADLSNAYLLLWGTGPGALLGGVILGLALSNRPAFRANMQARELRWSIIAVAAAAWLVPFAISVWTPVFLPTRTPVLLLPMTAVAIAGVIGRLGSGLLVAAIASLVVAPVRAAVAGLRGGDPVPSRASIGTVVATAVCGDTLLASGLSYSVVDYDLRQLGTPSCLHSERFPATMLNWTGRLAGTGPANCPRSGGAPDRHSHRRARATSVGLHGQPWHWR